jgi:hypothetical protein
VVTIAAGPTFTGCGSAIDGLASIVIPAIIALWSSAVEGPRRGH